MKKSARIPLGVRIKKFFNRRTGAERVIFIVAFVVLAIWSVSLLLPFLWMTMNSFKDGTEYAIDIVMANTLRLPEKWLFSNYADVFSKITYGRVTFWMMTANSFYYLAMVAFQIYFQVAVGYTMSKYEFKGRNFIFSVAVFAMTIPIIGNTAASVKLYAELGLYDNLLAPIITSPSGAWGFNFLMLYGFFKNVSKSYMEAATIDGAGHYTIFFKIMLPQATPMISTLFILGVIGAWNNYETSMLYFPSYPNLAYGLYQVSDELTRGEMPVYYAALVVTTVPILILFCLFSDKIMKNFSVGGLKG